MKNSIKAFRSRLLGVRVGLFSRLGKLATIFAILISTAHAANLSMSLDDIHIGPSSDPDLLAASHLGTAGFIEASTGTFETQARTTAEEFTFVPPPTPTDPSPPSELRTRVVDSQAILRMEGFRIDYGGTAGPYMLASGDLGIAFDADYSRILTNLSNGQQQYFVRMDVVNFDASGAFDTLLLCHVRHSVDFTTTTATDSIFTNISQPTPPVFCEEGNLTLTTQTVDRIDGVVSMPPLVLNVGEFMRINVFVEARADAGVDGGPYLPVDQLPEAFTNSYFSAHMIFNVDDPELFTDESGAAKAF